MASREKPLATRPRNTSHAAISVDPQPHARADTEQRHLIRGCPSQQFSNTVQLPHPWLMLFCLSNSTWLTCIVNNLPGTENLRSMIAWLSLLICSQLFCSRYRLEKEIHRGPLECIRDLKVLPRCLISPRHAPRIERCIQNPCANLHPAITRTCLRK